MIIEVTLLEGENHVGFSGFVKQRAVSRQVIEDIL